MKQFALIAVAAAVLCAQAPLQLPIADLPPDTIVARTSDGKSITAGEIHSLLGSGDGQAIAMARGNPEQFLTNLFVMRHFATEGEKAHVADQSPLKEQLEYMRNKVLAQVMLNQMRETYRVPDEAVSEFYAHNQSRYEQAWIKVIAIGFCPVPTAAGTSAEDIKRAAEDAVAAAGCKNKHTEQQAHDLAFGLVGKIRAGADFVKVVAEYSEDPDSKATQGDFGLVTRDNSFKQEIKDATFALRDDDVSNPIRSGNFFYIIKIKEKNVQPLSSVREPIVQELKQKHFVEALDDLTKRFKPEILRPDFFTAAKQ